MEAPIKSETEIIANSIKAFAKIMCPVDREITRHLQRRVLAHWEEHRTAQWHILVQCTKCKLEHIWYTNIIPEGMTAYKVRINAQGRVIPEINKTVPSYSEEFVVLAINRQGALRQASFTSTMPLGGQLVETLINGVEERDERY